MRVPKPGSLRLDSRDLLADVRERLSERLPQYRDTEEDPTDPGWLLLEQSAWMVELLSEQLDQYPYAVVQQFVHMMGGQLRPARPALGVLLCALDAEGTLTLDRRRPSPWRFFTPQDEDMESVEFVPAESGASLRQIQLRSLCAIEGDELMLVGPSEAREAAESMAMWRGEARRSRAFEAESIRFRVVTNNADAFVQAAEDALARIAERNIGWLRLSVSRAGDDTVVVLAEVDPAGAFARVAPAGIWQGGDLTGDWERSMSRPGRRW